MFWEITEDMVKMRMEQFHEEAARAKLVKVAMQAQKSNGEQGNFSRRAAALPGQVQRWWQMLTQDRSMSKGQVSTGM